MDPKILLTDKETIKKEAKKYLDIFKDHPYIFNLGHGYFTRNRSQYDGLFSKNGKRLLNEKNLNIHSR